MAALAPRAATPSAPTAEELGTAADARTGCHGASWIGGPAVVDGASDESGMPLVRWGWVPADRARIVDDWRPSGLHGSGSHSTSIDEQDIDLRWTFDVFTTTSNDRGPYRTMVGNGNWPIAASAAAVQLGNARRALDEARSIVTTKAPMPDYRMLAANAAVQRGLTEAEGLWQAAHASVERELEAMWDESVLHGELSVTTRVRLDRANVTASRLAVRIVDSVVELTGLGSRRPPPRAGPLPPRRPRLAPSHLGGRRIDGTQHPGRPSASKPTIDSSDASRHPHQPAHAEEGTMRALAHPTYPDTVSETRLRWRRHRRTARHPMAALVAGALAISTLAPMMTPASASASRPTMSDPTRDPAVIASWNTVAMGVLTPSGRPLLTQPFVVAAMHVAMYDAVVAVEGGYRPFGNKLSAPRGASSAAAAAVAAHDVLVAYLPASASVFDAALVESLATVPDGTGEADGAAVGRAAAAATLADRAGDGSQSGPLPPVREPGPGVWAPTPPATSGLTPWLAYARPFAMRGPDQFRPQPPPALGSMRYRRALDEVRRLGAAASTERTAEQTLIARFWGDQPIAQNQRALRNHADGLGWDIAATARLFAAVLTSQADALIACWDAKYHFQLWRPWQSVPTVQPGWAPLLGTPNHPEFPSAHGCVTGSLGYTLSRLMGTGRIGLTIDAANLGGLSRHYATRQDLLTEVGEARIWGGLHYRFSVDAGLHLAHRVVNHNLSRNFRPVG